MKRRVLGLAVFILLMPLIFVGCGNAVDLFKPISSEQKKIILQAPPAKEDKVFKNPSVIVDTVVDLFEKPDTRSTRLTQVLYNQQVDVLTKKDIWVQVKTLDNTTGWLRDKYIDTDIKSSNESGFSRKVVVTSKIKHIYWSSANNSIVKDVLMGTELFVTSKRVGGYEVALPQKGTGWIDDSGVIQLDNKAEIPKTSALDFITTLDKFRGSTYQLGGIGTWGVDAAGLVYICSRINGVNMPRELLKQYDNGTSISVKDAKPGDLVFFSSTEELKDIVHVGVMVPEGKFIHSSNVKGAVIITPLNDPLFDKKIYAIKRIF